MAELKTNFTTIRNGKIYLAFNVTLLAAQLTRYECEPRVHEAPIGLVI